LSIGGWLALTTASIATFGLYVLVIMAIHARI